MVRLCFDYGHGGKDSGSIYNERKEKDDVLKVGTTVAKELRRHGITVDETRTTDATVSLGARSNFENKHTYNYFISFHRNAYKAETAQGVETYTYMNQSTQAKSLAGKVQTALVGIGFKNRGVKKGNFHVLRETRAPAILVEIGFIDNTKDNQLFDARFHEIVTAVAKAILTEVGIQYVEPTTPSNKQTLYRVMAGSYANRENAEKQVKKLKESGFEATIMPYNT